MACIEGLTCVRGWLQCRLIGLPYPLMGAWRVALMRRGTQWNKEGGGTEYENWLPSRRQPWKIARLLVVGYILELQQWRAYVRLGIIFF